MTKCLICSTHTEKIISFGKMPIANGFIKPDQFDKEYFFDLEVGFCPNCTMVQLMEQPDPKKMFHENYAFFSSTSALQVKHFGEFSQSVIDEHLNEEDPFVVEIGSNDGIMLENFHRAGIRHLGVEPSENVANVAIKKGINTTSAFFDEKLADNIISENGKADAILAANVMCHIPYLHSVAAGIKKLLKKTGVLIFEDPYLGDIIEKTSYDQIYDEHAFYFSVVSIAYLFGHHQLEVVDVLPQRVHGGSMRYVIAHKGEKTIKESVKIQLKKEKELSLDRMETFHCFRKRIEASRNELIDLLKKLKEQGKRVVGYAATSKSTTVTNFCGINPDLVEYISDTTPIKQGKYSPGAHIPVKSYELFKKQYPDMALLFAWNHAEEIMAKEKQFIKNGGKWIVYVPEVKVIE